MTMPQTPKDFEENYETHVKRLKLNGLQPKTIMAYSLAVRRAGKFFDYQINALTESDLTEYFSDLRSTHSWSSLKHDLYGLKFYYEKVLRKDWPAPDLVKPPTSQRLPDIVTVEQMQDIIASTKVLSYRVFFHTIYSLGLRLSEGLRLEVGDIDGARQRIHVRNAKGNKDRLVPLPAATYAALRAFWAVHRNPVLIFPSRRGGLDGARTATTPLDAGGVQLALHAVIESCGLKKESLRTACATATPPTCLMPASAWSPSRTSSATAPS
jgi:site-specific recombinase XerD